MLFIRSSMGLSREMTRRRMELAAQKLELDYQKLYNAGMEAVLNGLSAFRHDYGNALAAMAGYARLGEWEKLSAYLEELCREKDIVLHPGLEGLSALKNSALAGLFAAKLQKAKEAGVAFRLAVKDAVGEREMKTVELCRAVGILLDNGVEGASSSKEKNVHVEVFRTQNGIVFRIQNTVDGLPPIHRMAQKGYTTKQDGSGLGLYLLEEILRQSPGSFLNTLADEQNSIQELCIK
ncbi:MAG: GHKL domain-containing protein [Clostridia bacterium]|nr:GHKL domain-containing protein [Clostridia bacterium]